MSTQGTRIRPSPRGIAGWALITVGLVVAWNGTRLSGLTLLGAVMVGAGMLSLASVLARRSS
jgi:hypothetical protein